LKVLNKLSAVLLTLGLTAGAVAVSNAELTVTTTPSDWTTGVSSSAGNFVEVLAPFSTMTPFGVVKYGSSTTVTVTSGTDTFGPPPSPGTTVHLDFDVSNANTGVTNSYEATGYIAGTVGTNGGGFSNSKINLTSLVDTTTGAVGFLTVDKGNNAIAALEVIASDGVHVQVDTNYTTPKPGQSQTISGFVFVPELGTSVSMAGLLLGGCLLGRGLRRRK
jgi:hypothetical protein